MTTISGIPVSTSTAPSPEHSAAAEGTRLEKFLDPLHIPPVIHVPPGPRPAELEIAMRATWVRLHSQLPPTRVWAYDGSFPGPTIDVRRGGKLRVTWRNEITGSYPVTAVEVQNATPGPGRDGAEPLPDVEALPPWTVVHLHGARTSGGNDGWTENAVLPGNAQLSEYPNDQQATTLWYHDHAMAITRLNVMAGLAGMYLIRDAEEDCLRLPCGEHEIPLMICDRNLDTDAEGNLTGQLLHKVKIDAVEPEKLTLPFRGPFTLVNGVIWPHLDVDARWYRFRMVNASNSRFYTLQLRDENGAAVPGALHQIGTDGGLLPAPLALDHITLAPAERADVLIDFRAFRGRSLTLVNAPLEPGPGIPDPEVMQFRVRARPVHDSFTLPPTLSPSFVRLTHDTVPHEHEHRWLVLTLLDGMHPEMWEMKEIDDPPAELPADGIVQIKLGGTEKTLQRVSRDFKDAATFYVDYNGWEQWSILNVSGVAHPIHLHLTQFQALSRDSYDWDAPHRFNIFKGGTETPLTRRESIPLDANEQGWKDVIRVGGGQLVRIAGQFGGATGRFMYHCHILEHEDEGMMGTFIVMPMEVMKLDPHVDDDHHVALHQSARLTAG